jgi:acyl-CoA reductase-like NAD-dependent aldehyde dehydrogenase
MSERYRNFIGGKWVDAAAGTTSEDLNPANKGDLLGSFPRSDHRDVDRAVEAARVHASDWRRVPALRRAELLFRAGGALAQREEEIAALVTRETGKVLGESRAEVQEAVRMLYDVAARGEAVNSRAAAPGKPGRIATAVRVPVGTVAVITPWNFPVAIPAARLAPALAAGNAVVFKPPKDAPLCGGRLVELFQEAGVPPGVINVVHGFGEEAGAPLVRHPDVALVSFTGSGEVGREVAIACAADHRSLILEQGELGAALVSEDADLDLAVEGSVWGALRLSGQRSGATARLFIHKKALKEFTDRLLTRLQALRLGDGLLPVTDLGPLVNEAQLKRVHSQTKMGVKEGAKLLCGGEISRDGDCKRGFFYPPTVFADATPKMRIVKEEVFGPTLALVTVASLEEAIGTLNSLRSCACALLYTRDPGQALRAAEALHAGSVSINTAADALRFSGAVGCPGVGQPGGWPEVLPSVMTWKTIALDYGGAGTLPPAAEG